MISSSLLVPPAYMYLVLWYLFVVLMLSVVVVLFVVKKGSRKRKSDLTGAKSKKKFSKIYDNRKEMETFISKNRSYARAYYIRHCNRVKSKARVAYKISKKYKLGYSKKFHALNPGYILQKCKNWYNKNKYSKILKSTCYSKTNYRSNPDHKKEASRDQYHKNPQPKKEASRDQYHKNPQPKKEASRNHYQNNPNPQKSKSKERYHKNPGLQKQNSLKRYYENRDAILRATKDKFLRYKFSDNEMDKLKMALNKENKRRLNKDYYEHNYGQILYRLRSNYSLPAPNCEAKEYYFTKIIEALYYSPEIVDDLLPSSMKGVDFENISYDSKCNAASSILLESVLKNRSHKVGVLIRASNSIRKLKLNSFSDFGEQCHTKNSEPYFYESAYLYPNDNSDSQLDSPIAIPVDTNGICYVAGSVDVSCIDRAEECNDDSDSEDDNFDNNRIYTNKRKPTLKWQCTDRCKPLLESDISSIIEVRRYFDEPIKELRKHLDACDNCPNNHYTSRSLHVEEIDQVHEHDFCDNASVTIIVKKDENNVEKYFKYSEIICERIGHPIVCSSNDTECKSMLRILRNASVHYPLLRRLLKHFYVARNAHLTIDIIDSSLADGDIAQLIDLKINEADETEFDNVYYAINDGEEEDPFRIPNLDTVLYFQYSNAIDEFKKALSDQAVNACCSCERLLRKKSVTEAKNLDSDVWNILLDYIRENDPTALNKVMYICNHCKPIIRKNEVPARCVLNGLKCEPLPKELENLDPLSCQLIQRAKCFQTIVRLGTHTLKVPTYNSLKALKGAMFYLPLPLEKTMETLNEVGIDSNHLPNPELYIIINGQPTKSNNVWRSLVDVNKIKAALRKLKEINWLYRNVDDDSIDESSKNVIQVVSNTTCKMLEKANDQDLEGLSAYTIRNLDSKIATGSDISQYKLMNVKEAPIDNRQEHLDLLCFPTLFPTGQYGEHHPRQSYPAQTLSFSEYIKSRLLNKDSRFRRNHSYCLHYYGLKINKALKTGIYNLLKTSRGNVGQTVAEILEKINVLDEEFEGNLSTMLAPIRGTNQYWFRVKGEVKAMIAEYGSPTLFLTLSCAEYDSADIAQYLRKVNNAPQSYSISRLCTEDPVSVSRQFSYKFKDFFNIVILQRGVLGKVEQYYVKKEYQMRGAPHYHILLWIENAPVVGIDRPEEVCSFIQDRITCHIPDSNTSPDLNFLVTKYQMHKCSKYCKRNIKVGKTYVSRCRFDFPRPVRDSICINDVENSLKSCNKIYYLKRNEKEVRVNDYNPLLLKLWRANMDLQYIAERSLSLTEYVTGYVTKAEKSHAQDLWDEVSSCDNIYSRLWKIGQKLLRAKEVGLYEASDLLLGESLYMKSVTVQYVNVYLPHKRSRKIKNYSYLTKMDRSSKDIFNPSIIEDFYPTRPNNMEDVSLYEFVANYKFDKIGENGEREYKLRSKPVLPNHRKFNPMQEAERDDFYYSLIFLFVPFRDESTLVMEGETMEEAFRRHRDASIRGIENHFNKLQKLLEAERNWKKIVDARNKAGFTEEELPDNKEDDEPQLLGEIMEAVADIADMHINVPHLTLEQREAMLNVDQKRIFDKIKSHLLSQKEREDLLENESSRLLRLDNIKPLRMFISGVGGTGKSFLIEAIKCLVDDIWHPKSSEIMCAIVAPTGIAAFNVGGLTIHRLFQLPIEHEGKTAGYWALSKEAQKRIKMTLKNLKIIIVDEVSMVSNLNLAYLHMRLEDIFGTDEWFGSKNILFVGDLLQLPPVNGRPVFNKISNKLVKTRLGAANAVNIWKETVEYDELTINERQKGDETFFKMLDSVRHGCLTDDTIDTLKSRVFNVSIQEKYKELESEGTNPPICLFSKVDACQKINELMLESLETEKIELACVDVVDESGSTAKFDKKQEKKLDKLKDQPSKTAGLETVLSLAVGCRVMLRRNIDVTVGLVNGAIGTVMGIYATRISIKFDHIDIPCDIERVTSRFMLSKNLYIHRKQFPLILSYAITIHKCQGLSLDAAIIDLSTDVFGDGMAYVALSRVRTLNGLHLLSFDPLSVKVSNLCINEINRLRSKFRKDLPQIKKSKGKKRKIQVTGIIDDGEPCSKNAKVSVSHVQSTSNSTVSSNKRKITDLQKSNRPKKSKICDDNALNKPCTKKRKVDVDSSADNSALALPRPKTDDKLIVSINLKDLKTKFNVKDEDSCSSLIVSIKLSNIKCKPKDDKTKCVVRNDHCSSGLIVSIKLSSIKLKTSNPKKDDDVIFTYEEPPNPDNVRRRQRDYVYYPANEDVQRRWCEILNLKFVAAARILPGSPTTPLSDERVPNSTLDVPGDGNCLFYALSYLITGSISQHYELRRAIVSNMPNFEEELFNSTLSATRYSSIYDYINKSKMYRNYVWATDTEIITLTALLGITIYSYSLTPTFVGWARYGTQELYGIPCDTTTPALYLKHVGTNHFQAVKSINIS